MIIAYPLLGLALARLHGAGALPKVVAGLLWALPFAYLVGMYNVWLTPLTLILCTLGMNTGHGNWFDLGTMPSGSLERLEFIIIKLRGRIGEYWYDVLGMALKGTASISGVFLILPQEPWLVAAFILGALLTPVSYMIGWSLWSSPRSTEFGECLSGFFRYLPFVLV